MKPSDKRPTPLQFGRNTLRRGQTFRVLLEALHAEEFGPDGYLGRTRTGGPECPEAQDIQDALPRMKTDATETDAPANKTSSAL